MFLTFGTELRLNEPRFPALQQFGERFHPHLSVLDVLMFNESASVARMLANHLSG